MPKVLLGDVALEHKETCKESRFIRPAELGYLMACAASERSCA